MASKKNNDDQLDRARHFIQQITAKNKNSSTKITPSEIAQFLTKQNHPLDIIAQAFEKESIEIPPEIQEKIRQQKLNDASGLFTSAASEVNETMKESGLSSSTSSDINETKKEEIEVSTPTTPTPKKSRQELIEESKQRQKEMQKIYETSGLFASTAKELTKNQSDALSISTTNIDASSPKSTNGNVSIHRQQSDEEITAITSTGKPICAQIHFSRQPINAMTYFSNK